MSASEALARDPGAAVSRRPLGDRVGAARWLIPPLIALVAVVALNVPAAPPATVNAPANVPLVADDNPLQDVRPATELVPLAGVDTADIDQRIEFWRARLVATPGSNTAWTYLGDLFEIRGRQTGDIATFVAAREAYARALEIAPRSADAHIGVARIMATLHDFAGALDEASAVLAIDPRSSAALAVLFDASLELGDIDNADLTLATLSARADSPAIILRAARLEFVRGDTAAATALADQAAADAEGRGEPPASLAFYFYAAAEYGLLAGDIDAAQAGYDRALAELPGFALAQAGQGRVAFARGDIAAAIAHYEAAVASVPRPDLLAYLGDLYALAGDAAAADEQHATVEFSYQLASADGQVYDREHVLFLADHRQHAPLAVAMAQAQLAQRQDVYAYDTLAWALHAAGRDTEALEPVASALALGTRDAKLLIHAGLIEMAAGRTADGQGHLEQALALNPSFSPLVVRAAHMALDR